MIKIENLKLNMQIHYKTSDFKLVVIDELNEVVHLKPLNKNLDVVKLGFDIVKYFKLCNPKKYKRMTNFVR